MEFKPGMKGKYRGKDIVVDSVEGNSVKILQGGEVKLVEKEDLDQNTEWSENKNSIITSEERRAKGQDSFGSKKNTAIDGSPYTESEMTPEQAESRFMSMSDADRKVLVDAKKQGKKVLCYTRSVLGNNYLMAVEIKNASDYGDGKTEAEARAKLKEMGYTEAEIEETIKTKKEGQAKADSKNDITTPQDRRNKGAEMFGTKKNSDTMFMLDDIVYVPQHGKESTYRVTGYATVGARPEVYVIQVGSGKRYTLPEIDLKLVDY